MTYRRIKDELQIDAPARITACRGIVTETWNGTYRGCRKLDGYLFAVLTNGNELKLVELADVVRAERLNVDGDVEVDAC